MMRAIKVIPNAKKNKVVEENGKLRVYVTAPPADNKANIAVVQLVADFLQVKRSRIRIIKGVKSRDKVVQIDK